MIQEQIYEKNQVSSTSNAQDMAQANTLKNELQRIALENERKEAEAKQEREQVKLANIECAQKIQNEKNEAKNESVSYEKEYLKQFGVMKVEE